MEPKWISETNTWTKPVRVWLAQLSVLCHQNQLDDQASSQQQRQQQRQGQQQQQQPQQPADPFTSGQVFISPSICYKN